LLRKTRLHPGSIISAITLLILAVPSCTAKYPSLMQAEKACRDWLASGPSVVLKFPVGEDPMAGILSDSLPKVPAREFSWKLRDCKQEAETRQWIGLESSPKRQPITATWPCPRDYDEYFCVNNPKGSIDFGPQNIKSNFYY